MKTLVELFELAALAAKSDATLAKLDDTRYRGKWFINYSGHVNLLDIQYFPSGWSSEGRCEKCSVNLDDNGIQEAYWFINNRLTK